MPILLLTLLLACRSGQLSADEPVRAVPVHPSWAALELPTTSGTVVFSDADMLTLHVEGGDPAALGNQMRAALEAGGYTVASDTSAGDLVSMSLTKGESTIALSAMVSSTTTTVSLTRFGADAR